MDMGFGAFGELMLARIYTYMERHEDVVEIFEQRSTGRPRPLGFLLGNYVRAGKVEEGMELLKEIEAIYDSIPNSWDALVMAEIYAAVGDYENAVKWYSSEPHHHFVPWVRVRVVYDSAFHDHPGFKKLMRRFNLPDPAPFQYNPELDI
jgi:hypothetical protein